MSEFRIAQPAGFAKRSDIGSLLLRIRLDIENATGIESILFGNEDYVAKMSVFNSDKFRKVELQQQFHDSYMVYINQEDYNYVNMNIPLLSQYMHKTYFKNFVQDAIGELILVFKEIDLLYSSVTLNHFEQLALYSNLSFSYNTLKVRFGIDIIELYLRNSSIVDVYLLIRFFENITKPGKEYEPIVLDDDLMEISDSKEEQEGDKVNEISADIEAHFTIAGALDPSIFMVREEVAKQIQDIVDNGEDDTVMIDLTEYLYDIDTTISKFEKQTEKLHENPPYQFKPPPDVFNIAEPLKKQTNDSPKEVLMLIREANIYRSAYGTYTRSEEDLNILQSGDANKVKEVLSKTDYKGKTREQVIDSLKQKMIESEGDKNLYLMIINTLTEIQSNKKPLAMVSQRRSNDQVLPNDRVVYFMDKNGSNTIIANAQLINRAMRVILGDGNCLFRSVIDQLNYLVNVEGYPKSNLRGVSITSQDAYNTLRHQVCDYLNIEFNRIVTNWNDDDVGTVSNVLEGLMLMGKKGVTKKNINDKFAECIEDRKVLKKYFDRYISSMNIDRTYGDYVVLIAIQKMFKVNLAIFSDKEGYTDSKIQFIDFEDSQWTMYLAYLENIHYNSLIPISYSPGVTILNE